MIVREVQCRGVSAPAAFPHRRPPASAVASYPTRSLRSRSSSTTSQPSGKKRIRRISSSTCSYTWSQNSVGSRPVRSVLSVYRSAWIRATRLAAIPRLTQRENLFTRELGLAAARGGLWAWRKLRGRRVHPWSADRGGRLASSRPKRFDGRYPDDERGPKGDSG